MLCFYFFYIAFIVGGFFLFLWETVINRQSDKQQKSVVFKILSYIHNIKYLHFAPDGACLKIQD